MEGQTERAQVELHVRKEALELLVSGIEGREGGREGGSEGVGGTEGGRELEREEGWEMEK